MNKHGEKIVKKLGIEFWKTSTKDSFVRWAELLFDSGIPEDTISRLLSDLYYAVSGEFGG